MRALALQAVGLPRQVERGEERQVVARLRRQGRSVEAGVGEHQFAVDGDHQRAGVGDDDVGARRRSVDQRALMRGDAGLLVDARRARFGDAEIAQRLVDHRDFDAAPGERRADRARQHRLAGAFGAEQDDDEGAHAGTRASGRRCSQARQPIIDMTTKTA